MAEPLPTTLRAAVTLVWVEAVGVGGVAVFLVYELFAAEPTSLTGALFVTACAVAAAAALAALARALNRRSGAARGPAVMLQLLLLPVGYYMLDSHLAWLGVTLLLVGLVTAGLLVAPPSTRALGLTDRRGGA